MILRLPSRGLVALVGPSGSGKSTFAARHFRPTEVLSSDAFRAIVADDPNDQAATDAAFELLHTALALRLASGRLSVVDATNVERRARERLVAVARRFGRPASAIVLDLAPELLAVRARLRTDRSVPGAALRRQTRSLRDSLAGLSAEGFSPVHVLASVAEVDEAIVERG